jgi:DNA-binding NarL/FixJ family response regulator
MADKSILLVDDEEAILASIGWALERNNFKVTTAKNGREAIELLHAGPYDLVVTDLLMAEVDGIAVLQLAKTLYPESGVIILTGFGHVASAVQALKLGADDYLQKPCDIDDLLNKARHSLERQDLVAELRNHNARLQKEMAARRAIELELQESHLSLERQVRQRTAELTHTVDELKGALATVRTKEQELQEINRELQDINTTFSTMLKRRDREHDAIRQELAARIGKMVLPMLTKARAQVTGVALNYLDIAQANLLDVVSEQPHDLVLVNARLAPRELQIVHYLRQNKTSKEMAELLDISVRTVESYRENIRKKLRIKNQKKNLKKFITSII